MLRRIYTALYSRRNSSVSRLFLAGALRLLRGILSTDWVFRNTKLLGLVALDP